LDRSESSRGWTTSPSPLFNTALSEIVQPRGFGAGPKPTFEPRSIYVHVPFCAKKCPYCHFFVLPNSPRSQTEWIEGIRLEWRQKAPLIASAPLASLYFGGGTPALLDLPFLEETLSLISPPASAEITLEANPADITLERLKSWRALGINRLSIGVQSFDDPLLATLGRNHTAEEAIAAVRAAAYAGFDNLSIDLMTELPGQTLDSWRRTLSTTATLPISHLSLYNLTFEAHTPFYKRQRELRAQVPSEALSLALLEEGIAAFEKQGLGRYEISAFSLPGKQSIHNTGYWIGRPFLGLGPSAFSDWGGSRFSNPSHLGRYLARLRADQDPADFRETLPFPQSAVERFLIRLRLLEGASAAPLPAVTRAQIAELATQHLLIATEDWVSLSPSGLLLYDEICSHLILA
jgi:oxygen-independent coproporphyrinogen-3 oxidase